jgi:hypothetical protein
VAGAAFAKASGRNVIESLLLIGAQGDHSALDEMVAQRFVGRPYAEWPAFGVDQGEKAR